MYGRRAQLSDFNGLDAIFSIYEPPVRLWIHHCGGGIISSKYQKLDHGNVLYNHSKIKLSKVSSWMETGNSFTFFNFRHLCSQFLKAPKIQTLWRVNSNFGEYTKFLISFKIVILLRFHEYTKSLISFENPRTSREVFGDRKWQDDTSAALHTANPYLQNPVVWSLKAVYVSHLSTHCVSPLKT